MKSNIGFVFVVNSERAFGRFVKESAGKEEMASCSSSGEWRTSHLEHCRLDVESETDNSFSSAREDLPFLLIF